MEQPEIRIKNPFENQKYIQLFLRVKGKLPTEKDTQTVPELLKEEREKQPKRGNK